MTVTQILSTEFRIFVVDMKTGRQSIRSGKYPWCSDLSLCGKNMHSTKARYFCADNLQVVTRGCHVVAFLAET